jgi:molecular chaperone GrpE
MWPRKKDRPEDAMKAEHEINADEPQGLDEAGAVRTPEDDGGPQLASSSRKTERELESLRKRIVELELERSQLNQDKLRAIADYQNFARRAIASENEAKLQGITAIVLGVIPVLDHFDLALNQDPTKASAEQIITGVKVIRDELLKVLQRHGISIIHPEPGEEFDPTRHQAVLQQQDENIAPGHIVQTLQSGYALNDRAVRPASVSVRPSE